MTLAARSIFLDTNILVYASVAQAPLHTVALNTILTREQAGVELWTSRQVLREYLAALNRTQTFTPPIPIATLIIEIQAFENRFQIAEDGPQVTANLLTLLNEVTAGGKQIHDANIVATMQAHGLSYLLTHNTGDFNRFANYITVMPLA